MSDTTLTKQRFHLQRLREALHAIAADFSSYSTGELLELKNTTDTTSDLIRAELHARDARMVDEACALGDAA